MTTMEPELWIASGGAAVTFYATAFGARVEHQVGAGDDIVARLAVGGARFWVAAASQDSGRFSPQAIGGATGRTLLHVEDPDAVQRRAVAAGATETSPVADEHGWRLGRIVDPFGHEWEIGRPVGHGAPAGGEPPALRAIGRVESSLTDAAAAPLQGREGAPDAWLVFEPDVRAALDGVVPGDRLIVLSWLDRARRDVLRVHPRGDRSRSEQGVFTTRSPDRPNPIGLHEVELLAIDGDRLHVRPLEALDGTPILDVKPVL